jgi:gamma-glutamyltranspeptidase / glutathione hydrolase
MSQRRRQVTDGLRRLAMVALLVLLWGCAGGGGNTDSGRVSVSDQTGSTDDTIVSMDFDTVDYDDIDVSDITVEVPPELKGYRRAYEEDDPAISRQEGTSEPAVGGSMAVTARDPVAARVGFKVLRAGGNAGDAAFAVGATISVTEPWFSHMLGGGTWALYRDARGRVEALDGAGTIGSLAEATFFRNPENLREHGMEWTIVPGAWDAWMVWLDRYGTMELDDLLAPAIDLAENGAPAGRTMVGWITQQEASIASRPHSAAVFLPGGAVPSAGDTIVQSDLARTLKIIVQAYRTARPEGRQAAFQAARDVYYRGPIGRAVAAHARENRGSLADDDFSTYTALFREPLVTAFDDWVLYTSPPGSQGAVMAMALNTIQEALSPDAYWNQPETVHIVAEAMNLAHIDKHFYMGDPDSIDIPLDELLSREHAARQARRIRPDSALQWPQPGGLEAGHHNTTTFSVVDADGNAAAITTSVGAQFVVAGNTGIVVNQRLQNVFYDDDNPNRLVPGRRVRHTVNPYMAELPGKQLVVGGNTGYDTQPQGQIQQFLNIARFDANAQEAVSRPRYIVHSFPDITYPHTVRNELALEWGYDRTVQTALEERGHRVSRGAIFGNANVIVVDLANGGVEAGGDHRGENLALAQ